MLPTASTAAVISLTRVPRGGFANRRGIRPEAGRYVEIGCPKSF